MQLKSGPVGPMGPFLGIFKLLAYFLGHLFDISELKATDGFLFRRQPFSRIKMVIVTLLTFATFIFLIIYCLAAGERCHWIF